MERARAARDEKLSGCLLVLFIKRKGARGARRSMDILLLSYTEIMKDFSVSVCVFYVFVCLQLVEKIEGSATLMNIF